MENQNNNNLGGIPFKNFQENINKSQENKLKHISEQFEKGLPGMGGDSIGTERKWKDGKTYKKQADGSWKPINKIVVKKEKFTPIITIRETTTQEERDLLFNDPFLQKLIEEGRLNMEEGKIKIPKGDIEAEIIIDKVMPKEEPDFIDILNNPEAKELVEAIEYIDDDNLDLVETKQNLIKKLKDKYNYIYRTNESQDSTQQEKSVFEFDLAEKVFEEYANLFHLEDKRESGDNGEAYLDIREDFLKATNLTNLVDILDDYGYSTTEALTFIDQVLKKK